MDEQPEKPLYHAHVRIALEFSVSIYDRIGTQKHRTGDWSDVDEGERRVLHALLKDKGIPLSQMMLRAIIWEELFQMHDGSMWEEVLLGKEEMRLEDILKPLLKQLGPIVLCRTEDEDIDSEGLDECFEMDWLQTTVQRIEKKS